MLQKSTGSCAHFPSSSLSLSSTGETHKGRLGLWWAEGLSSTPKHRETHKGRLFFFFFFGGAEGLSWQLGSSTWHLVGKVQCKQSHIMSCLASNPQVYRERGPEASDTKDRVLVCARKSTVQLGKVVC